MPVNQEVTQVQPEFLRAKDVALLLSCSKRHVANIAENDPAFPKKIYLGSNHVGWIRADILAWLRAKAGGCAQ